MTKTLILALGVAAMFASCSQRDDENPTGSWVSATPQVVTQNVADATSATKTISIDFTAPVGKEAGALVYAADYDMTASVPTDSVAMTVSYKVTASIIGTWTQNGDDDDEYLLTFDTNTLSVKGTDAPELGPVTDEFLTSLTQFMEIDDVKVSKDGNQMSFETNHPDVKYYFVKK